MGKGLGPWQPGETSHIFFSILPSYTHLEGRTGQRFFKLHPSGILIAHRSQKKKRDASHPIAITLIT